MSGGIELAPLMTRLRLDTSEFESSMGRAGENGAAGAQRISDSISEISGKVGDKLTSIGSSLTTKVSLPIVGLGVAAGKMAVDFESSFAKVSTLLDANSVDYDAYKDDIINASSDSKVAVDEFSESVYGAISAGVDQSKAVQFTTEAMKLAKGGFTDGASAVDVLTTAINGYKLSADDATKISDMLITTQNLGKTTVNELASSMGAVIPVASSVNFGIDELSTSYAVLTKNGIATSEAGTYLKSMLSELGKSGSITDKTLRKLTKKGFAELKAEGMSTTDILAILDENAKKNDKSLKDMFGSVEAGSAALVLANSDGKEYNEILGQMQGSAGATQEAFEKMDATPAERLKGAINDIKNAGIKLGDSFVPIVELLSDKISELADWMSSLSEEEQKNILKWGTMAIAFGPVVSVVGKGIGAFSKLSGVIGGTTSALGAVGGGGAVGGIGALASVALPVAGVLAGVAGGIYAVGEKAELMNSSVLKSRDEMSWLQKAMADFGGMTTYTKDELVEMGLKHKDFSENISPEFQEAVKNATEEVQEFNVFLHETTFDGTLSKEESAEFEKRVTTMVDNSIKAINDKQDEVQKALTDLFTYDGGIDESEQIVLNSLNEMFESSKTQIEQHEADIIEIKNKGMEEKGYLNDIEIGMITAKNNLIKQIELEAVGGTQEELLYAKNEFIARAATMELDEQSELLQEKSKIRDDEIVNIKASYDTEIEMLKTKMEKATDAEKVEYQKQIENLSADKEEKIKLQEDTYEEYVDIVTKGNEKALNEINKYNGTLLTQQDREDQQQLENLKTKYKELESVTKDGCYKIFNPITKETANLVVDVDEKTGDIIGISDVTNGIVGGYTSDLSDKVQKMGQTYTGEYDELIGSHYKYNASTGQVTSAGEVTGKALKNITEKADGTKEAIIELNGKEIKVNVDKDGTITPLKEIDAEIDNVINRERGKVKITYINEFLNTGIPKNTNSINYNGLNYVPFDGYTATLHKGERVLTREENTEYSNEPRQVSVPQTITTILQIDGREFTRATMPYIDKQMRKDISRRE